VERILITVGGSDAQGLSARLADLACRGAGGGVLDVVVGPFVTDVAPLEALAASRRGRVRLHRSPQQMRDLMLNADLAISAGGQTLFELAATATPTVAVQVAPNQAPNLRALAARGALWLAGEPSDPGLDESVVAGIGALREAAIRARMGDRGRAAVDGRGTARVAEAMLDVFSRTSSRTEARR
jgi:spore coat polysaccharide biosynthesis predicted glycosyltransferase SpsG